MKTKVFKDQFKGSDCFAVWPVDEAGNKVGNYPVVSFGVKKAAVIFKHLQELEDFIKSSDPNRSYSG